MRAHGSTQATSLDPESAAASGVLLNQLLWIRCRNRNPTQQATAKHSSSNPWPAKPWSTLDQSIRAADLLLQAGGFAAIILDLGGIAPEHARRISSSPHGSASAKQPSARSVLSLFSGRPPARSPARKPFLSARLFAFNPQAATCSPASTMKSAVSVALRQSLCSPSPAAASRLPPRGPPWLLGIWSSAHDHSLRPASMRRSCPYCKRFCAPILSCVPSLSPSSTANLPQQTVCSDEQACAASHGGVVRNGMTKLEAESIPQLRLCNRSLESESASAQSSSNASPEELLRRVHRGCERLFLASVDHAFACILNIARNRTSLRPSRGACGKTAHRIARRWFARLHRRKRQLPHRAPAGSGTIRHLRHSCGP